MRIMCSAHSSTTETPFHPSSPRLIKSSSVRFVDPSSHANERFNLQLVSFSIQDKSPSHFFFFSLLLKGRKKEMPAHFNTIVPAGREVTSTFQPLPKVTG